MSIQGTDGNSWSIILNGRILGVRSSLTTAVDLLSESLESPERSECDLESSHEYSEPDAGAMQRISS